jgi:hypothetical protein|tara:strand:+ start:255 stop:608 length:354 start_codon:yes stop_codon:yes gene_type:complete
MGVKNILCIGVSYRASDTIKLELEGRGYKLTGSNTCAGCPSGFIFERDHPLPESELLQLAESFSARVIEISEDSSGTRAAIRDSESIHKSDFLAGNMALITVDSILDKPYTGVEAVA